MSDFTDFFPVAGGVGGAGDGTGAAINEQIPLVQTSLTPGFDATTEIYTHPNGQEYLKSGKTIQLSQATYPSASPSVVGLGAGTTYLDGPSTFNSIDWVTHDGTNGWTLQQNYYLNKYSADWSTLISQTPIKDITGTTVTYVSIASDGTNLYVVSNGNSSSTRRIYKITIATLTVTQDKPANGFGGVPYAVLYDYTNNVLLVGDNNRNLVLQFRISDLANLGTYSTGTISVGPYGFTYNPEYDVYLFKETSARIKVYDATTWAPQSDLTGVAGSYGLYTNPSDGLLWNRVNVTPYFQLYETVGTYGIPTGVDPVTSQPYFWRIK